ncbi:MAG: imidazole glycerol phosphate synthase subunit HisH [Campylobacterales bacterium]|nr:imidazole glycerol phosphate synthase subunit HisH [Campylobacterales bacterium]
MNIGIIDYKMGNLASLKNSFEKIGKEAKIVTNADEIRACDKLVLPGVGGFGDAISHLEEENFIEPIHEYVKTGNDLLGVCLGMQLLFNSSDESKESKGLGLINGGVIKFDKEKAGHQIKIPHMGWNKLVKKDSKIFSGLSNEIYLYFVHSYYVECEEKYVIGKTHYGYDFVSAVNHENIYGLQPHPEKSHDDGLKILKNFIEN